MVPSLDSFTTVLLDYYGLNPFTFRLCIWLPVLYSSNLLYCTDSTVRNNVAGFTADFQAGGCIYQMELAVTLICFPRLLLSGMLEGD